MTTLPTTKDTTAIDFADKATIATLKATVAKGATDEEFAMFAAFCKSTGLNPFKKEIWFIKDNQNRVQMMTGINGFYEIANKHPQFDGIETEIVEEQGRLIKAVAKVYRKDRGRPMTAEAFNSEYNKGYGNWKNMPRVMLSKCAEAMALRKSFPQELNGLYTTEEMPREFQAPRDETPAKQPEVLAGDTPEWLEQKAPENKTWRYDIVGFPVEKAAALARYLKKENAKQLSETVWAADHELSKLKDYELADGVEVSPEAVEQGAAQ